MGEKSKSKGICVYIQLIHFIVQQKITQHCRAIILKKGKKSHTALQLKIIKLVNFMFFIYFTRIFLKSKLLTSRQFKKKEQFLEMKRSHGYLFPQIIKDYHFKQVFSNFFIFIFYRSDKTVELPFHCIPLLLYPTALPALHRGVWFS